VRAIRQAGSHAANVKGWGLILAMMLGAFVAATAAKAQDMSALARIDATESSLADKGQGLQIELKISQPVPYRVSFLSDPPRLIVDFREVDFSGAEPGTLGPAARVEHLSWGPFLAGWSRMVAVLDAPLSLTTADEIGQTDGSALIRLVLAPTTPAAFAAGIAGARGPAGPDWALPTPAPVDAAVQRQTGDRPLRWCLIPVMAASIRAPKRASTTEAKEMLSFALELAEVLRRAGMTVELTRVNDVFVPLETRISVARAAGADRVPVAPCRRAGGRARQPGRRSTSLRRRQATRLRRNWPNGMTGPTCWPGLT
jgi:N-acetylmuramoyl-L-alanine amidase